ncbi:ataxin-10 [Orussus abietinus]|uniref:ataxin-10 n=1 Tax=Orussus abietinus TaxID=222816 RepID=UPI0006259AC5|nr:ataxin-10 [Orussus abietinus]XP_012286601.1 ataxin-10 [Orussus abietinus]XP_012286602.1 ataxin-10 [Orussus abietinus]
MDLNKLNVCMSENDWDELLNILKPKFFPKDDTGKLIDFRILAKVATLLLSNQPSVPNNVKVVALKCLANSCVNGYHYKKCNLKLELESKHYDKLYSLLSKNDSESPGPIIDQEDYSLLVHFPYEGIANWTIDYITEHINIYDDLSEEELDILRLSTQFLCNFVAFAIKESDADDFPTCLSNDVLKTAIMKCAQSDHTPISKAACTYIHNSLKRLPQNLYTDGERIQLISHLIKPVKLGIQAAIDAMIFLLKQPNQLRSIYDDLPVDDKLYLLELLHLNLRDFIYKEDSNDFDTSLSSDSIVFLAEMFQQKCDLILKTVDSRLDGKEPTEIIILLDILGTLTTTSSTSHCILQDNKSFLINCIYLLKALHTAGKTSENYFTPVQKLSELAPSAQHLLDKENTGGDPKQPAMNNYKKDIQAHPAFGFKAGLIRIIGNLAYKHKANQDSLRETEAIPLLLDCCNMDARNPLIIQWTILAVRNVCEGNPENQNVIRELTKVGVVDSAIIREMGLTLHEGEDGKAIGVVPLVNNK